MACIGDVAAWPGGSQGRWRWRAGRWLEVVARWLRGVRERRRLLWRRTGWRWGGGGSATYARGLRLPGVTDGGDPRGPRFLPTRHASSGGCGAGEARARALPPERRRRGSICSLGLGLGLLARLGRGLLGRPAGGAGRRKERGAGRLLRQLGQAGHAHTSGPEGRREGRAGLGQREKDGGLGGN